MSCSNSLEKHKKATFDFIAVCWALWRLYVEVISAALHFYPKVALAVWMQLQLSGLCVDQC